MDAREQRGLQIAALSKIRKNSVGWIVPSQSGSGQYQVTLDTETPQCTCPDHEVRGVKCKHIFAVEYTLRRETVSDGETTITKTTETVKVTNVTYSQDWTAYNAAQCEEKSRFMELLADLCAGVPQPVQTIGRPRMPMSDMVFASTFKVYSLFSSRRFTSDLQEAHHKGFVTHPAHFNTVSKYMSLPDMTPVLMDLVTAASLPLSKVETQFAVDSSGLSTSRFVRWFNKKYGKEMDNREWVKCHLMCGVKTNVVTSVEISGWTAHDTNFFAPLLERTAKYFQVDEVSADKAYLSHRNMELAMLAGATPYIPFKSNTLVPTDDSVWAKMYHYFMFRREEFMEHYHKRSNVETTFSMVKGKFGDSILSKSEIGQVNEVLCKVLCHNICVVIQAIHELGIEPTLCAELPVAHKVAA
jgi:transposase